jgi:hypothetical protein
LKPLGLPGADGASASAAAAQITDEAHLVRLLPATGASLT